MRELTIEEMNLVAAAAGMGVVMVITADLAAPTDTPERSPA